MVQGWSGSFFIKHYGLQLTVMMDFSRIIVKGFIGMVRQMVFQSTGFSFGNQNFVYQIVVVPTMFFVEEADYVIVLNSTEF